MEAQYDADKLYEPNNLFETDGNLQRSLARIVSGGLAPWRDRLSSFGAWVGGEVDAEAAYTDRFGRPVLEAYDGRGDLTNRIRFNPAWEAVSRALYERGFVGLNYTDPPAPYAITFAMGYLLSQADISLHCPATMTGAVAYVLDRFAPEKVRRDHLPSLVRMDGTTLSAGTWATELHGGSDIGATTTVAEPACEHYRLHGLKWFASNPTGGLALATARPVGAPDGPKGLGLYLVPVRLEDGSANPMRIRRLKDKLGTCGVPTGEIDLTGTWACEVAAPPDGLRLMMEALLFSRLHNAMAAAGVQRRVFVEALNHAAQRHAFGRAIAEYPMVQDEILEILVPLEAGTALAFEAASTFDRSLTDQSTRAWLRLTTALAKFLTAGDASAACRTAMEVIGGNAHTSDHVMPRIMRDATVLSILGGTGKHPGAGDHSGC